MSYPFASEAPALILSNPSGVGPRLQFERLELARRTTRFAFNGGAASSMITTTFDAAIAFNAAASRWHWASMRVCGEQKRLL